MIIKTFMAVLLHGCRGITPHDDGWAVRLVSWGYVTLQVGSFGQHPESNGMTCERVQKGCCFFKRGELSRFT